MSPPLYSNRQRIIVGNVHELQCLVSLGCGCGCFYFSSLFGEGLLDGFTGLLEDPTSALVEKSKGPAKASQKKGAPFVGIEFFFFFCVLVWW